MGRGWDKVRRAVVALGFWILVTSPAAVPSPLSLFLPHLGPHLLNLNRLLVVGDLVNEVPRVVRRALELEVIEGLRDLVVDSNTGRLRGRG